MDVACVEDVIRGYGRSVVDRAKVTDFLRAFEDETGVLVTDLIQADRHLGRGFYTGGTRHPGSPLSEKSDYWRTAQLVTNLVTRFEEILEQWRPAVLLMAGAASLPTKTLCVCARRRGIPVRLLSSAGMGNRFLWAADEFRSIPWLRDAFEGERRRSEVPEARGGPGSPDGYDVAREMHRKFSRYATFPGMLVATARESWRWAHEKAYYIKRGRLGKPMGYNFSSRIVAYWNMYRDHRRLGKIIEKSNKRVADQAYFYLPLQTEPESTLMVMAPEFNNQAAMADLVAKALPAGVMLVVKEHPVALGRRPPGFYDWLASVPNVILAPPETLGPTLARGSLATVTITGTSGLEAAAAGVPVISLCLHNNYWFLDHVHVVSDFRALRDVVGRLANEPGDAAKRTKRKRDGHCLVRALETLSVDVDAEKLFLYQDRTPLSAPVITALHANLLGTLDLAVSNRAAEGPG